ncbi:MAG: aminopeptidase P family protein [Maricaulaceae bacterium]|jgi:Xaa-Pro aminopeptidase
MLSTFDPPIYVGSCAPKIAALRDEMEREGLDYLIVPHADEYQNEFLAAHAERLAWLTHFTGSAGLAIIGQNTADLFVDGRYVEQAIEETDAGAVTVHHDAKSPLQAWLRANLTVNDRLGVDETLHTEPQIREFEAICAAAAAELVFCEDNLIDRIWTDQPAPPRTRLRPHPLEFAGRSSSAKRNDVAQELHRAGDDALIVSQTDAIAWLFNIRGGDIPVAPLPFARAILHADATAELFVESERATSSLRDHLSAEVAVHPRAGFADRLSALGHDGKTVRADLRTCPGDIVRALRRTGARVRDAEDPCQAFKAVKNATEIEGARRAHLLDGVALTKFLAWFAREAPKGGLTELSAAKKLADFRRACPELEDLAFPSIAAAGEHAAAAHHVPTARTDRAIGANDLFMIDSGGQYPFGTTDVTRTIAVGEPTAEMRRRFTQVLKGSIRLAQTRFPPGVTGSQLDGLARLSLWEDGVDYDHATGHGIGSYLNVHEGPHAIARRSTHPLAAGMLVTNEPGYYKSGAFGLRIENVMLIAPAPLTEGRVGNVLCFETLTLAPIDAVLIDVALLDDEEVRWLDGYHERVQRTLSPHLDPLEVEWLEKASAPLRDR